jgi:hypothetical protein
LLRLTGARICLLFQLVRRQKYDLIPVTVRNHFSSADIAKIEFRDLSSPRSHPLASPLMGSLTIKVRWTRSHLGHAKVRNS